MSKTVFHDGDDGVELIVKDKKAKQQAEPTHGRLPVHVVYGGADRYSAETPAKLGSIALAALDEYAPNFIEFAKAVRLRGSETLPTFPKAVETCEKLLNKNPAKARSDDFNSWFAWSVYHKTREKLLAEPIEDFRIDFEDGYGFRPDDEEDADAVRSANELAAALRNGSITPFSGFRIKSLAPENLGRSILTLEIFLNTFFEAGSGAVPENFVVTLPKVTDRKQVKQLVSALKEIEKNHRVPVGSIGVEIVIETPEAIFDRKGRLAIPGMIKAAKDRLTSVHFGAYDYTSAVGIAAAHQDIRHRACSFARDMIQVACAPLGLRISDSVTTQIPLPLHRGDGLTEIQLQENKHAVHAGWQRHFANVSASMSEGFYQSWDIHPNQLPARYAAVYAFFLETRDEQAARLKSFIDIATRAGMTGNVFDDAASAQGLVNFFRQARDCRAMNIREIEKLTGLTANELQRSFMQIMAGRRASAV